MTGDVPAYGLWTLVVLNSAIFIYAARRDGVLATDGPYARVRHPQYAGFVLVMLGLLLQWPTLLTLGMSPVAGLDVRAPGDRRGARDGAAVRRGTHAALRPALARS